MAIEYAALNLFAALVLGALIGSERQVRRRTAGLRTNALVALGAAGFVVFSSLYADELSPTRVAAQVVSGIGFLGAGIIFREGFTVHGLNTAATLWCSAAVGVLSGGGHLPYAAVLTALVVFVNLGLRPLVRWIKSSTGALDQQVVLLSVRCSDDDQADVRSLMLRSLQVRDLRLAEMAGRSRKKGEAIDLTAKVIGQTGADLDMDDIVATLCVDPKIVSIRWEPDED